MSYGPITSLSSFPHLCFLTTLLFLLSPAHAVRASVLKLLSWPIVWLGSLSAILTSSITDLLHSELCSAGFLFTLGRTELQTPVLKFSCVCVYFKHLLVPGMLYIYQFTLNKTWASWSWDFVLFALRSGILLAFKKVLINEWIYNFF